MNDINSENKNNTIPVILIIGDSIAKGVVFSEQLNKYINIEESADKIVARYVKGKIINKSRFGNTTRKISKGYNELLADMKPDMLIIELGGNDCDFNWAGIAKAPEAEHNPNTPYAEYLTNIENMIDTARSFGIEPILATLPPLDPRRYFAWISNGKVENARNILRWLGNINKIYWWQERYSNGCMQVAANKDCRMINLREAFLGTRDYRKYYCIDGIHPNNLGHRLMADCILETISQGAPQFLASIAAH